MTGLKISAHIDIPKTHCLLKCVSTSWCSHWDRALDFGTKRMRLFQCLFSSLCHPFFAQNTCKCHLVGLVLIIITTMLWAYFVLRFAIAYSLHLHSLLWIFTFELAASLVQGVKYEFLHEFSTECFPECPIPKMNAWLSSPRKVYNHSVQF